MRLAGGDGECERRIGLEHGSAHPSAATLRVSGGDFLVTGSRHQLAATSKRRQADSQSLTNENNYISCITSLNVIYSLNR